MERYEFGSNTIIDDKASMKVSTKRWRLTERYI